MQWSTRRGAPLLHLEFVQQLQQLQQLLKSSSSSSPTLDGLDISIECGSDPGYYTKYSYENAWQGKHDSCEGTANAGSIDADELAALKAANCADTDDYEAIATLYAICAQNSPAAYSDIPWSAEQVDEVKGALMLCPQHPQAAGIRKSMAAARALDAERASGVRFGDGQYRVGKEIKAGRYESTDVSDGCYWERQDRNGNIIDNNFVGSASRVEVNIRTSDYGFETRDCGEWHRVK